MADTDPTRIAESVRCYDPENFPAEPTHDLAVLVRTGGRVGVWGPPLAVTHRLVALALHVTIISRRSNFGPYGTRGSA